VLVDIVWETKSPQQWEIFRWPVSWSLQSHRNYLPQTQMEV